MKGQGIRAVAIAGLLLAALLAVGCSSGPSFDRQVDGIVKPHRFNVLAWEIKAIFRPGNGGAGDRGPNGVVGDGVEQVVAHFSPETGIPPLKSETAAPASSAADGVVTTEKREAPHQSVVQGILEQQIRETLAEQGIYHPWYDRVKLQASFPPPFFRLEVPPNILVVSRRDRIETIRSVLLNNDLAPLDMARIEAEVDKLNVSSLVDGLGGLGSTYPALVAGNAGLDFVIDTAVHEWVHQYLFFTPLGFRYALDRLGLSSDADIATMNETVANIVGKEIGQILRKRYYPAYVKATPARPAFDFGREMREIRKAVDQYLAQGEIERAEQFMEQKRQYLAAHGYNIRKLNQAYFAFHGGYADTPAFINPIGEELKKLRSQKASVKDFLDAVAGMSGRQDLKLAAGETAK